MDIAEIKASLGAYIKRIDRKKLIVFLGLTGILLIFISEFIPDSKSKSGENSVNNDELSTDTYKQELQGELESILSKIDGVGRASVMITLEGTTEYVYAEELDTSSDNSDSSKRESMRSKIVITENGGDKKALIKKIIRPQVTGVLVACPGGDNILIREKVISAVSAVLGIPAGRVYVVKLSE